jgi:hypothetical protein
VVRGNSIGLMEELIMENSQMIKRVVWAHLLFQMVTKKLVIEKIISSMARDISYIQME